MLPAPVRKCDRSVLLGGGFASQGHDRLAASLDHRGAKLQVDELVLDPVDGGVEARAQQDFVTGLELGEALFHGLAGLVLGPDQQEVEQRAHAADEQELHEHGVAGGVLKKG